MICEKNSLFDGGIKGKGGGMSIIHFTENGVGEGFYQIRSGGNVFEAITY